MIYRPCPACDAIGIAIGTRDKPCRRCGGYGAIAEREPRKRTPAALHVWKRALRRPRTITGEEARKEMREELAQLHAGMKAWEEVYEALHA